MHTMPISTAALYSFSSTSTDTASAPKHASNFLQLLPAGNDFLAVVAQALIELVQLQAQGALVYPTVLAQQALKATDANRSQNNHWKI